MIPYKNNSDSGSNRYHTGSGLRLRKADQFLTDEDGKLPYCCNNRVAKIAATGQLRLACLLCINCRQIGWGPATEGDNYVRVEREINTTTAKFVVRRFM